MYKKIGYNFQIEKVLIFCGERDEKFFLLCIIGERELNVEVFNFFFILQIFPRKTILKKGEDHLCVCIKNLSKSARANS